MGLSSLPRHTSTNW